MRNFKGNHSKIVSSDLIIFFSIEFDGERLRSQFEQEDGKKMARASVFDAVVPRHLHARSREQFETFMIGLNQFIRVLP